MDMLTTGQDKYGEGTKGHAYLDWFSSVYKNCPSKRVADEVGRRFKEKAIMSITRLWVVETSTLPKGLLFV